MQSNVMRNSAASVEHSVSRVSARVLQLRPSRQERIGQWVKQTCTKEQVVVGALVTATLLLSGTLGFSLYQALLNYRVF